MCAPRCVRAIENRTGKSVVTIKNHPGAAGSHSFQVIEKLVYFYVAVALAVAGPQTLRAAALLSAYAGVDEQSNSNVFARPSDNPPFAASGISGLSDRIVHYVAGGSGEYLWSRERLTVTADAARVDYNRFTMLNHNEYRLGGKLDWHLGAILDGSLSYQRSRSMAPLADTLATQLSLDTESTTEAHMRIALTPHWRLDLAPRVHDVDTPLPLFPNFRLRETAGVVAAEYLGIDKLTAGLRYEYIDGAFHEIVAATQYHQTSIQFTAQYALKGLSALDAQLGYTRRNSELSDAGAASGTGGPGGAVGTTSSVTGSLGYQRKLTGKTSAVLHVFREVDSYVAGANSEIGTGAEVKLLWDPDVKLSVALGYRMADEAIKGNLAIANIFDRRDRLRNASLDLRYRLRPWLTLRPYAAYDQRSSNLTTGNYSATRVGIELTGRIGLIR
jgi:hypothetical protein